MSGARLHAWFDGLAARSALLQNALQLQQETDTRAMQAKLDELIHALPRARAAGAGLERRRSGDGGE